MGTMAIKIQDVTIINDQTAYIDLDGTNAVKVPAGTTAERPTGVAGQMRFNSESGFEFFDGADWQPVERTVIIASPNAYAWGVNTYGRLGDNTAVNKSSPVSVVGGFTDWIDLSAGNLHSLGVRANGTLWAWGINSYGQLGDGTTTTRSSPVSVVGGFTDWTHLSAGGTHSLGLRANGSLWAWGSNGSGRLGNNNILSQSSPVSVVGGFSDWTQASAGEGHSLGTRANGTLYAWGVNSGGQLGTNNTTSRSSPVLVVGGFTNWIQASAGQSHSLGVRANGTLYAWGFNLYGRLGTNNTTNRSSPVLVVGGFTDWVQASASRTHSLGLRANGTAWAWGLNTFGKLGDNTTTTRSSPVSVVGGFTDWNQVSAGKCDHSIGVRANGTLWSWGSNSNGELGDNSNASRSSPVSVVGGFTDWVQASVGGNIFAGSNHSLGIRA